ncbi:MAG: pilus assembly protein PilP [Thermodesulfobacteriota bacterium]|nr:pilus assembly protein PilP [Thermodesulfobacteriota bacterium]
MKKRREKRSRWGSIALIIIFASVFGCNNSTPPEPTVSYSPRITKKAADEGEQLDNIEKWKELFDTSQYFYNIKTSRDPFESPILKTKKTEKEQKKTPLEKWDIAQLKLIATLYTKSVRLAMVEDPDGRGHILRKGLRIGVNDGFIVSISENEVVVKEKAVGRRGTFNVRTITLPKPE